VQTVWYQVLGVPGTRYYYYVRCIFEEMLSRILFEIHKSASSSVGTIRNETLTELVLRYQVLEYQVPLPLLVLVLVPGTWYLVLVPGMVQVPGHQRSCLLLVKNSATYVAGHFREE